MESKEWIELADGTRLNDAYVVKLSSEQIAIYSAWAGTFPEAVAIFCDPEKTREIRSDQYGDRETWEGFTVPTAMVITENGILSVNLKKELMADV